MIIVSGLAPKPYSVTPQGVQELREQLSHLKHRRMQVASEMREITSQSTDIGALEDSTLAVNQNEATELDGQITLLERIIGMATVIRKPSRHDRAAVGSQVTVAIDGKERTYTIVGVLEADPMEGRISNESPLGRCLLGKRVGERCEVTTPAGRRVVATILRIG